MLDLQPVVNMEEYIDVQDALSRVCGNTKIYKSLLLTFKKTLQFDALCKEIAEGDFEMAAKTAHSIKGVTANLSLKAAYHQIVAVESSLKRGFIDQSELAQLKEIIDITLQCTEHIERTL